MSKATFYTEPLSREGDLTCIVGAYPGGFVGYLGEPSQVAAGGRPLAVSQLGSPDRYPLTSERGWCLYRSWRSRLDYHGLTHLS